MYSLREFKTRLLCDIKPIIPQKFEDLETGDPIIFNNWGTILDGIKWSEQLRYQIGFNQSEATNMVEAIAHPQNGILKCIKNYW